MSTSPRTAPASKATAAVQTIRGVIAHERLVHPGKAKAGSESLDIPFPTGLAPVPTPIVPAPAPEDSLPHVDVIAMMDTVAESEAMADVLTPGTDRTQWYPYTKNFLTKFLPQLGPNAPARQSKRLGSYYLTKIAGLDVLVYKTELHMHTDGKLLPDGSYTLPIKDMLAQMIGDAQPKLFLTTGTSGGVYTTMSLGDVSVSRAAMFHCKQHYAKAPFNGQTYKCDWTVPTAYNAAAQKLMDAFTGKLSGKTPPAPDCSASPAPTAPRAWFDGQDGIAPFHPIITTDFFEFGTSTNNLDQLGMAVEMDDAVLGLVCFTMKSPPLWSCVRNLSDPCINGDLPPKTQGNCAEFYYSKYGYWTTVMSALVTWGIVCGLTPAKKPAAKAKAKKS